MKIAAFNVENLFDWPKAFNPDDTAKGAALTEAPSELNTLINHETYDDTVKARMLELIKQLKLTQSVPPYAIFRKIRRRFWKQPCFPNWKADPCGQRSPPDLSGDYRLDIEGVGQMERLAPGADEDHVKAHGAVGFVWMAGQPILVRPNDARPVDRLQRIGLAGRSGARLTLTKTMVPKRAAIRSISPTGVLVLRTMMA